MYYALAQVEEQVPTRTEIVLSDFEYEVDWLGVSDRLATWQINNESEFSFLLPIDIDNDTFALAVAWTVDGDTFRLVLHNPLDNLYYPAYNGERIGANAQLEIWSVSAADAISSETLTFQSSFLNEPELCVCLCSEDAEPVQIIAEEGETTEPPTPEEGDVLLVVQGVTELRTLTYTNHQFRYLGFLNSIGDGQGGVFEFRLAELTSDDGIDYIKPTDISGVSGGRWVRQNNG